MKNLFSVLSLVLFASFAATADDKTPTTNTDKTHDHAHGDIDPATGKPKVVAPTAPTAPATHPTK